MLELSKKKAEIKKNKIEQQKNSTNIKIENKIKSLIGFPTNNNKNKIGIKNKK